MHIFFPLLVEATSVLSTTLPFFWLLKFYFRIRGSLVLSGYLVMQVFACRQGSDNKQWNLFSRSWCPTSRLTGETEVGIRQFHIDHNASFVQPPKFCLTIVSNFSWVLQYYSRPERNRRQWLCKILWGKPIMAYVKMVNAGITNRA